MHEQLHVRKSRARRKTPLQTLRIGAAFATADGAGLSLDDFPVEFREPEGARRRAGTLSFSILLHGGALAILVILASLAPVIEEEIIPVALIRDEPDASEPAPAPRALAERRSRYYAPAVQAVTPQIVNPQVVAEASPAVPAATLDMEAVNSVAAPIEIDRPTTVVDRVAAVNSIVTARASDVDVTAVGGPAVRGPIRADAPIGPSVGPRKVTTAAAGTTTGTGKLEIGGGSSVREGILSTRDVHGSPTGAPLVNVASPVGEGNVRGSGGTGRGTGSAAEEEARCFALPGVQDYLETLRVRTIERWSLPPGVASGQEVVLKFRLDVAGSASAISLVHADDNALGASGIDALRAASPFPPVPNAARCLTRKNIIATFSNPGDG